MPRSIPNEFMAEWKWDGIRVQAVTGAGEDGRTVTRLYSRTGEDISKSFPDLAEALRLPGAIDGELLIVRDGRVQSFNVLQQRLNRKAVTPKLLLEFPAHLRAYDLLVDGTEDLRDLPFAERRARLQAFVEKLERSARRSVAAGAVRHLGGAHRGARRSRHGRRRRRCGSGRGRHAEAPRRRLRARAAERPVVEVEARSADRRRGADVCPARPRQALVVLFRLHLRCLDARRETATSWCRSARPISVSPTRNCCRSTASCGDNTIERFGPVREVTHEPDQGLVFEVAFEGLQRSTRHKSGLAMRFPRISRLRWDKPPREADRLETLEKMLAEIRERPR